MFCNIVGYLEMPFLTALPIMLQEENQMLTDTAYCLCTCSSAAALRYSLAIKLTCQAAKKKKSRFFCLVEVSGVSQGE